MQSHTLYLNELDLLSVRAIRIAILSIGSTKVYLINFEVTFIVTQIKKLVALGVLYCRNRVQALEPHRLVAFRLLSKKKMNVTVEKTTHCNQIVTDRCRWHIMAKLFVVYWYLCCLELIRDLLLFGDELGLLWQNFKYKIMIFPYGNKMQIV